MEEQEVSVGLPAGDRSADCSKGETAAADHIPAAAGSMDGSAAVHIPTAAGSMGGSAVGSMGDSAAVHIPTAAGSMGGSAADHIPTAAGSMGDSAADHSPAGGHLADCHNPAAAVVADQTGGDTGFESDLVF